MKLVVPHSTIQPVSVPHTSLPANRGGYVPNEDAHSNLYMFILPSMLARKGFVMSVCASDAMVVQYTQRKPMATRGDLRGQDDSYDRVAATCGHLPQ
ncbi:hypothetical protein H257_13321 [Aphanomyces astaci]|uniref:Uncharacterized protein n=1 Tax=Aphanomyces astaci TaxID=112090 RepID=W4FXN9_APHAT|nr:hypothetical protein H257_13321 [Aphanomyces astaci]ETV71438.1 hypothetical protein H257_13321 [Aphanomyces astaci]|eukprot:XP_009839103.1 hypothetical protein H257_13321 [Aphanomyces astaci]